VSGCQKTTLLALVCVVAIVFVALFLFLQGYKSLPPFATPTPLVLHTPTARATRMPSASPSVGSAPIVSATSTPFDTVTPTSSPTDTPVMSSTPTETVPADPSPLPTDTPPSTSTSTPAVEVPAEVMDYLEEFVQLVVRVDQMHLLGGGGPTDEGTVDQLREVYRLLHEMEVPSDAEEMNLAFIIYVSVLEEKCLCHIFAEAHAGDAQGEYYRECENRATSAAMDIMSSRFIPSREVFLQQYGLAALELGFPY